LTQADRVAISVFLVFFLTPGCETTALRRAACDNVNTISRPISIGTQFRPQAISRRRSISG
jgi:hypothetical protein